MRRCRLLISHARQIANWNQDLLPDGRRLEFQKALKTFEERYKRTKRHAGQPILSDRRITEFEQILRDHGGGLFSGRSAIENSEALLVTLILALGLRTFFFQPFQIPTNSMVPSYHGMSAEEATVPCHWLKNLGHGTRFYRLVSPATGALLVPLNDRHSAAKQQSWIHYGSVRRRRLAILPTRQREYEFLVGDRKISLFLPKDFDLEPFLFKKFLANWDDKTAAAEAIAGRRISIAGKDYLQLAENVGKGDPILQFNLRHGDMLFVNRLIYHFRRPKKGEAIVFSTGAVPALAGRDRYYIKRLAAEAGDRIEIIGGKVCLNGRVAGFLEEAIKRAGGDCPFAGYFPYGLLAYGSMQVDPGTIFVLGDNSKNSYDSRFFGPIPEAAIRGRPALVFYPFHR